MLFNDDSSVIVIGSWTENMSNNLYHHVYDDKNETLLSLKSYYDKHINEMKEMAIVDPMDSQNEYFFIISLQFIFYICRSLHHLKHPSYLHPYIALII